jgi:phage/plasmid-like protein (TIGR03299 family)
MTTDQMFSSREVPWLKLGRLEEQAVTAKEAAELGGLNFTVSLCDIGVITQDLTNDTYQKIFPESKSKFGTYRAITNRKAVIADDDGSFMGITSSTAYRTLNYGDAFSFMDAISPDYVAAGTLHGRRQGFMVVRPKVKFNPLGGEDAHELFVVLRTSHDCTRATEVSVMPLRGRCMNQLTLRSFSTGVQHRWSIKHTSTQAARLAEAQTSLQKLGVYARRYEELAARLADRQVNEAKARQLLKITIPMPNGKTARTEEQYRERLQAILNLWSTSPTCGYAGTGWGLVNAVSEYFEWYRAGGTPESRFIGVLGEGQTHKRVNRIAGLLLSNS